MSKNFLPSLAVLSVILSSSFCEAAPNRPNLPGCTDIAIKGSTLSARCPIGAGSVDPHLQNKYVTSTSKWPCESNVPLKNCEGLLTCTTDCSSAPALPTGSYLTGCDKITFGLDTVTASCSVGSGNADPKKQYVTSTLKLPCAVPEVSNCGGVLTCGPSEVCGESKK